MEGMCFLLDFQTKIKWGGGKGGEGRGRKKEKEGEEDREEETGTWMDVSGERVQGSHSLEGTLFSSTIYSPDFNLKLHFKIKL